MKTRLRRILVSLSSHRQFIALLWLTWASVVLLAYYAKIWFPGTVGSTGWEPYAFGAGIRDFLVLLAGAGLVLFMTESLGIKSGNTGKRLLTGQRRILLCSIGTGVIGLVALAVAYPPGLWQLPGADFGTRYFPALGEASYRAVLGILGAGQVILAACVLGFGICRLLKWKPGGTVEALLYYNALGLGGIAYLSLGLASLGQYRRASLTVLILGVIICGALWFCGNRIHGGKQREEMLATSQVKTSDAAWDRLWRFITILAVLTAFIGALAPETEYDALSLHLGLPKVWLEQGRMVDVVSEYVSLYPMHWELIFGAGLALGGPVAAKLLHFSCLLLTALLVYQLAKRYLSEESPWLAVVFFVTIPTVLWEGTTAYIDLALTLHVGLAVYALLRYVEGKTWTWLALAIINLGLALSTKHLAWFALILAAIGLVVRLWFGSHKLRRVLFPAMIFVFLSLLLALPWYIRSWQASGNPFFPEMFGIFGAQPPGRWDVISEQGLRNFLAGFGRPRTVLNLLSLPWDMTIHAARYGGTLGPLFLTLLPGLILFRRRAQEIAWFVSFVLLYLALWASPISSFQMRFLLPITPFLAVLAAESINCLTLTLRGEGIRRGKFFICSALTILFLLNLPPFLPLHEVDREGWKGWLNHVIHTVSLGIVSGRESREGYLTRCVPSYASWRYINTHVPRNAHILTFSGGDNFYSERRRIWGNATLARPATWGASAGKEREALQALADLGISHVLFDKKLLHNLPPGTFAIAQPSILNTWYEREYEDRNFVLYRIRWEWLANQTGIKR